MERLAAFDAHEITNMLGQDGLEYMLGRSALTPLAAYMQVPSSVPSTDCEFERTVLKSVRMKWRSLFMGR